MNPKQKPDYHNIKEIEFETELKHKKGMLTEDSVINRLTTIARSLKSEILRRVEPPSDSNVGECDSIIFDDSGIYIVEIKRYGGKIKILDEKRDQIIIEQSDKEIKILNPIPKLYTKCSKLHSYLKQDYEWKEVNNYSRFGNLGASIPVYSILCFGPSTTINKSNYDNDRLLVCNTRNISKLLPEFVKSKSSVIGLSMLAKKAAYKWTIQGKLTLKGKKGFLRCYPKRAFDKTVVLYGLTKIVGKKGRRLELTYGDKVKIFTKEITKIYFKYNFNHNWQESYLEADTNFTWTSGNK
ncbi:MAG: NERD domain-containing protein [bacterium]|nr:NERD domain-containing protein [bacterium]